MAVSFFGKTLKITKQSVSNFSQYLIVLYLYFDDINQMPYHTLFVNRTWFQKGKHIWNHGTYDSKQSYLHSSKAVLQNYIACIIINTKSEQSMIVHPQFAHQRHKKKSMFIRWWILLVAHTQHTHTNTHSHTCIRTYNVRNDIGWLLI